MREASASFSIVVPTYACPRQLAACLKALSGLDYPKDRFEVVVVDDGVDISLDDAVAPARQRINLTLHRQPNAGPATARNTGARIAQGEYLAFTDDDCAPAPAWLSHLAGRLAETPAAMVGGRTVNALPDNPFSQASQSLMSYLYLYYEASSRPTGFLASNNLALPTEAFRALGGFDVRYPRVAGKARDLCDRWCAAGGEIVYAPQARVWHHHALSLRTFWRQHYNYGRGAYQFRRGPAGAGDDSPRRQFEPFSFYFGLLRHSFRGDSIRRAAPMAGLFVISQIATVAGFATEGLTGAPRAPVLLAVVPALTDMQAVHLPRVSLAGICSLRYISECRLSVFVRFCCCASRDSRRVRRLTRRRRRLIALAWVNWPRCVVCVWARP